MTQKNIMYIFILKIFWILNYLNHFLLNAQTVISISIIITSNDIFHVYMRKNKIINQKAVFKKNGFRIH